MQPQTGQKDGSATENGDEVAFFLRERGVRVDMADARTRARALELPSSLERSRRSERARSKVKKVLWRSLQTSTFQIR